MSMSKGKTPLDKAIAWCRREYRKRREGRGDHCSFVAEEVMAEAEKRFSLGTFGVEGFAINMDSGVTYLNTGDTYDRTIIFQSYSHNSGRWSLGAWGDLAERLNV